MTLPPIIHMDLARPFRISNRRNVLISWLVDSVSRGHTNIRIISLKSKST